MVGLRTHRRRKVFRPSKLDRKIHFAAEPYLYRIPPGRAEVVATCSRKSFEAFPRSETAIDESLVPYVETMAPDAPLLEVDRQVLETLRKGGSDLSKPHPIDHYLYFSTQHSAESVGRELAAIGFRVSVRPSATPEKGYEWLVLASQVIVPAPSAIASVVARLGELATSFGGLYDGWEAKVVR